jgi:hypothetical protein
VRTSRIYLGGNNVIRFLFAIASLAGKFIFIMGIGTLFLSKPFFVDTDSRFEVIRSKEYVYQVNYEKDNIDSVEIFTRDGDFKGQFEYTELKGNHKKIIDAVKY